MKKVMVQYVSESLGCLSGTVIAELDAGDESLNCSKLWVRITIIEFAVNIIMEILCVVIDENINMKSGSLE